MVGTSLRSFAHPTKSLQLACIRKRKRAYTSRGLVEDQCAGDRRFGALAAILALAKPAVDADRRAFRLFQIHAGRIDQLRGVADFATKPDCKARFSQRMRRNGTA